MTKRELNCSSFVTSWYNFSPPMGAVSLSKFYFSLRNKNRKKRIPKKKKGVLVHGSLVDGRRRKSKSGLLLLPSHFLCFSSLPSDRGNKIYWANKRAREPTCFPKSLTRNKMPSKKKKEMLKSQGVYYGQECQIYRDWYIM